MVARMARKRFHRIVLFAFSGFLVTQAIMIVLGTLAFGLEPSSAFASSSTFGFFIGHNGSARLVSGGVAFTAYKVAAIISCISLFLFLFLVLVQAIFAIYQKVEDAAAK